MSKIETTAGVVSGGACPRCKTALIDPGGLGWCKSCGYCKSLEDGKPVPEQESKPNTVTATGSAVLATPMWVWVTLFGLALVVGATFALNHYLTLTALQRATLTTVQSGVAFGLIIFGQFIGLMKVAPDDSSLGFFDCLFPFRLYGFIFKRLPATRLTMYLGVWGLAAIISVNVIVGGLGHWLTYLPDSKKMNNQVQKTKKT